MHRLFLTILLLGVSSIGVLGDVKCFLTQLTNCSKRIGGGQLQVPTIDLCLSRAYMFECIREKQRECNVNYNMDSVEAMYERICTNGTDINKQLVKYADCISSSIQRHASCSQDIMDFTEKVKNITPEVIFGISKLACREQDCIMCCLYGFIGEDCGREAKSFMKTVSAFSDKVNKEICRDVLNYP